ncbi:amino acid adenylation domain-containing protein [Fulvivirga sp. 29W222]|uniref:Amino acid adenylation domain-containing protein n=1 Tax=Fulvivirga marina TaxID=2494733 RepID=A0A937G2K0_9BACT|nr:non-ribosomal peptide synthetase [Fulvivirga marina]MBL6449308.1 amino acid adenylation domain-containing protein [Fulvivirga marina]
MKNLLTKLRNKRIELTVVDGKLKVNAPTGVMTKELLEEIKGRKEELVEYIEKANQLKYTNIPIADERDFYLLSSAQRRLYFLYSYDTSSLVYNIPKVMKLDKDVDVNRLTDAFNSLIKRHESLRTSFKLDKGEPVQVVHNTVKFNIEVVDAAGDKNIAELIPKLIKPFDLAQAPILKATLIKDNDSAWLVMDIHHIIADGTSVMIMEKELKEIYEGHELKPLEVQYKDFSEWQLKRHASEAYKSQERYWLSELGGELPVLNLPFDYPRPDAQSFRGGFMNFQFSADKTKALRLLCEKHNITTFTLILSIYQIMLSKACNQEQVLVGSQVASRNHDEIQGVIGNFVNTLVFQGFPEGHKSFLEYIDEVKEKVSEGLAHQEYKFDELVEKVSSKREPGRNPVYDAAFVFQNYFNEYMDNREENWKYESSESTISKFDIDLECFETKDHFDFTIHYCTDLFRKETIGAFIEYIEIISDTLVSSPDLRLQDVELLTTVQKEQMIQVSEAEKSSFVQKPVNELFEQKVQEHPDKIALINGDLTWTFQQLNQEANRIAQKLLASSKTEKRIAVFGRRDFSMIAAIIGVLKSGKTYLAIDENYPPERIQYMLQSSQVHVVVNTGNKSLPEAAQGAVDIINVDEASLEGFDSMNPDGVSTPDEAYIIYTSGTSGQPKGVVCLHEGLGHYVQSLYHSLALQSDDVFLHTATFSFSSSVRQLFMPLCHGHTLVLAQKEEIENPVLLFEIISRKSVSVIDLVPSYLRNCLTVLNSQSKDIVDGFLNNKLRLILTASEPLPVSLVNKLYEFFQESLQLINMYGQTETTGIATTFPVDRDIVLNDKIVPIGRPITNTKCYVLDKYQNLVPNGLEGELYIAGPHLAKGYIEEQNINEDSFSHAAFFNERIYKTGDVVKYNADGILEYKGRKDNQIKIRGFRIEPEEIAAQIQNMTLVDDAIVTVLQEDTLVAYYVAGEDIDSRQFIQYLVDKMPDYMVPVHFVRIERIPLTPNGKVDKSALPAPSFSKGENYVAPADSIEQGLAAIWGEILKIDEAVISTDKSFFELGGHSLKAIVLSNSIHQKFGVEVSLREIFRRQNIIQLAGFIRDAEKSVFQEIPKASPKEYYALSSAQKRLYFLNQMNSGTLAYNMPQFLVVKGELDFEKFESAFKKLIDRHASLRTSFHMIDGVPKQKIHDSVDFEINYSSDKHIIGGDLHARLHSFDLTKAPLLRVDLIRKTNEEYFLIVDIHHLITDGASQGILINDLKTLYDEELPPLRTDYKDYAEWQQTEEYSDIVKVQQQYWKRQFAEPPEKLALPIDFARQGLNDSGDFVTISLEEDIVEQITEVTKGHGTTNFVMVLTVLNVFLSRLCNQDDIVIGVPSINRNHADVQDMVGLFLNTLALRNFPQLKQSFSDFLDDVKTNMLEAQENQNFQFEDLLELLDIDRDINRNPLFDVFVNYLNFDRAAVTEIGDLQFEPLRELDTEVDANQSAAVPPRIHSRFDLTFYVSEGEGKMNISMVYKTSIFAAQTIAYLAAELKELIVQIANKPDTPIGDYQLMSSKALRINETKPVIAQDFESFTQESVESTIDRRFEGQVEKFGNHTAIKVGGVALTYEQLNNRANQIAHSINQLTNKNEGIALLFNMGANMIVSMIGVVKTNAFYIPVDPAYPQERIGYMLEDSAAEVLLVDNETLSIGEQIKASNKQVRIINIDEIIDDEQQSNNLRLDKDKRSKAYLLYTSGTTGRPKAVVQIHRNVLHFARVYTNALHISEQDRLTLLSTYCFDASVMDIYGALLNGATLYPYNLKTNGISAFRDLVYREDITIYHSTPSVFRSVFDSIENGKSVPQSVRLVVMGGEAVLPKDLQVFINNFKNDCIFINGLGPTESTITIQNFISKDMAKASGRRGVPVGYPVEQTEVLILNSQGKEAAVFETGEIVYKSEYLALGYWNNKEATEKAFVEDINGEGGRYYRSGDQGRRRPDGTIEFLGRNDRQVKVNGYRVELEEIESQMLRHEYISQAVVQVDELGGGSCLVAYYTTYSRQPFAEKEIKSFMSHKVASFMLPRFFIFMDKLPLTPNGKLDRKALPKPALTSEKKWAPSTEIESRLASLWADMLQVSRVSIPNDQSFFEVGGDSLKLLQLNDRMNREFSVKLDIVDLFRYPTLEGMANLIEGVSTKNDVDQATDEEVEGLSDIMNLLN